MTAAGDEAAFRFAQAWAAALPAVSGYIGAVVPDRHAADDLVQEVALAAFQNRATWRTGLPFTPWALGIARNKLHDRWRRLARGRHQVADPALLDDLAALAGAMEDELAEERRALEECLRTLGGKAAALVQGRYHQGLGAEQLAARLGTTAGNVRVMLHRVREALRACIGRRLGGAARG